MTQAPWALPERAQSSPRHACTLRTVLFLHHLHARRGNRSKAVDGKPRATMSLRIPAPTRHAERQPSQQMDDI